MRKSDIVINPILLKGNWTGGWALDYHTISSSYNKSGGYYKTKRTALGEALYRLKYKKRWWWAGIIAKNAANFLDDRNIIDEIDFITTIPPARSRFLFQPVNLIGKRIGRILDIPVKTALLKRSRKIPPVKLMEDPRERFKAVKNLFSLASDRLSGQNVLILDDLYRSGATLREAAEVLKSTGSAGEIYVLAITKTRVNR